MIVRISPRTAVKAAAAALALGLVIWLGYSLYAARAHMAEQRAVYESFVKTQSATARAKTWCERAEKKRAVGKIKQAQAFYDRCAAEDSNYGKLVIIDYILTGNPAVPRDVARAEKLAEAVTSSQRIPALLRVAGAYYEKGQYRGRLGRKPENNKALAIWEAAAKEGNLAALGKLKVHYSLPAYLDLDKVTGYQAQIEALSAPDDPTSAFTTLRAGTSLLSASFKDERLAGVEMLKKITQDVYQGDTASLRLGQYYLSGKDGPPDAAAALALFDAVDKPRAEILYYMAHAHRVGEGRPQDYAKARELFKQAADSGYLLAYAALGHMYRLGVGVEPDAQKALEFYQKLSREYDARSDHFIGYIYASGALGASDYVAARAAYQRAVEARVPTAYALMARLYEQGHGVPQDPAKAFELMKEAGERGSNLGRRGMVDYYERGIGTARDFPMARIWKNKIRTPQNPLVFDCDICDPKTD